MRFLKNIAIAALVTTAFAGTVMAAGTDGIDLSAPASEKNFRFLAVDYGKYAAGTLDASDEEGKLRNAIYAKLDDLMEKKGKKDALRGAKSDFDMEGVYAVTKGLKGRVLPVIDTLNPQVVLASAGLVKTLSSFGSQADIFSRVAELQSFLDDAYDADSSVTKELAALLLELDNVSQADEDTKVAYLENGKDADIGAAIQAENQERLRAYSAIKQENRNLNDTLEQLQQEYELLENEVLDLRCFKGMYERLSAEVNARASGGGVPFLPAKPSDSKGPAKPSDSKGPAKPSDSKGPAKPSDSKGPAKPSDFKGPAKPSDSKGPAKPSDSKGPAKPSDLEADAAF